MVEVVVGVDMVVDVLIGSGKLRKDGLVADNRFPLKQNRYI